MESVMAEIGVAVIGFGLAGRAFHAHFVHEFPIQQKRKKSERFP